MDAHITAWRQWTMVRRAVALARKATVDHEPYVNGGGAAFTGADVASVIGNSLAEAIDDAMETMDHAAPVMCEGDEGSAVRSHWLVLDIYGRQLGGVYAATRLEATCLAVELSCFESPAAAVIHAGLWCWCSCCWYLA